MPLTMKFPSLWRFNIAQAISPTQSLKFISTQVNLTESTTAEKYSYQNKIKKLFTSPPTPKKIEQLNDLTSITLGPGHISWAKISVPNPSLLEWNAYELPVSYMQKMNEIEISDLVINISQEIPKSNLYVFESLQMRICKFNDKSFRTALIMFLNNFTEDSVFQPKVIIQDYKILNILYDLKIGYERKSVQEVVEQIFKLQDVQEDIVNEPLDCGSFKISYMQKQFFNTCVRIKQESLSLALLIAFTFLDLAVLQSSKTNQALIGKLKNNLQKKKSCRTC